MNGKQWATAMTRPQTSRDAYPLGDKASLCARAASFVGRLLKKIVRDRSRRHDVRAAAGRRRRLCIKRPGSQMHQTLTRYRSCSLCCVSAFFCLLSCFCFVFLFLFIGVCVAGPLIRRSVSARSSVKSSAPLSNPAMHPIGAGATRVKSRACHWLAAGAL